MLGNHLPRHCGIATFTADLSAALLGERPDLDAFVLAVNDTGKRYAYPEVVRFEIAESEIASYGRAADYLNVNDVELLSVQHEYGIFGGKAGSHVLTLLRELRMPVVTTLHTILAEPNPAQRDVMGALATLSDRLVVMSANGKDLLHEVHAVPLDKIDIIPHGIPAVPKTSHSKVKLGVDGRPVILTFGLLSPDKGVEHVIDALPAILERYPETIYIVLGATHPHIKERSGESYRLMLETRAQRLGVAANVMFHDRFVSHAELVEFLSAADIYITPYLKEEQITSGTLAYALGSGKAVISTPYRYARELLAEGRGVLVPWRDAGAIATEVNALLGDEGRRSSLRARALAHGLTMTWPIVARGYLATFERAREEHRNRLRTAFAARTLARRPAELPEVDLRHVQLMTDDTGMLQHAIFTVPRYEDGYCLDDNARALRLAILTEEAGVEPPEVTRLLTARYLAFVSHAFDEASGRFRNFLSYGRTWLEERGSEDSHGRALWALGTVVGRSATPAHQALARRLFHAALPGVLETTSPRTWAYALLGIDEYLGAFSGDTGVESIASTLAGRLLTLHQRTSTPDWPWFEDRLTYANARLCQALLAFGRRAERADMTEVGLRSLEWLISVQLSETGDFSPIGSNGFYVRGGPKAAFDQQPVEACAMIAACLEAFRVTQDRRFSDASRRQFNWFVGQNDLRESLYDPSTGGCRDGLHEGRVNENQGAESTLSFVTSLLELRLAERTALTSIAPRAMRDVRRATEALES